MIGSLRFFISASLGIAGASLLAEGPDYWAIESAAEREKLPLYKVIPAAAPDELTPAGNWPDEADYMNWTLPMATHLPRATRR